MDSNLPFAVKTIYNLNAITLATLKKVCPAAAKELTDVDHDNMFWVIGERPELVSGSEEDGDEVWSQTNEVELAVWLAEDWDKVAVPFGDKKVVFLCGTWDDEYGNFWSAADKKWFNYSF